MSNSGSSSSSSYRSSLAGDDIEPEDPADSSSYRSPSPPPRVAAIVEPPRGAGPSAALLADPAGGLVRSRGRGFPSLEGDRWP